MGREGCRRLGLMERGNASNNNLEMLAHDIKAPLAAILVNAELMLTKKKAKMDEEVLDMAASIHKGCERIMDILDNALIHDRIGEGADALKKESTDIRKLISELGAEFGRMAKMKGRELHVEIDESLPDAYVDRTMLMRAVSNLLENALKYTYAGGNILLWAGRGLGSGSDLIFIKVVDDGPGVPQAEQEKVFDKYYRSRDVLHMKGAGLGLYFVRAVVEAHRGRIELFCGPEGGCSFIITLPVSRKIDKTKQIFYGK